MSRRAAVVGALGAFVLAAFIGLVVELFGREEPEVMRNRHTGEPLTLEAVKNDLDWHRETARKLRKNQ